MLHIMWNLVSDVVGDGFWARENVCGPERGLGMVFNAGAGCGNPLGAGCYPLGCPGCRTPAKMRLMSVGVVSFTVECNVLCVGLRDAMLGNVMHSYDDGECVGA